MKKLIAGAVLGFCLATTAYGDGDPEAGKANATVCAGCHGQGGAQPIQPVYPKLSGLGEAYLFTQLRHIKSGDRQIPEMTGLLDNMSEQDLQDLAAYFNQQQMPIGQANPELVEQGKELFRGGSLAKGIPACSGCHNPQGMGNEPAAFPRLSGQHADYVVKQLKAYRDGERSTGAMSQIMIDIAAKLSDDEMEAVASYVSGLH
ncbi:c-type cytochrome [Marinobacter nanhaiticus D15-8W]|uniref:Cytochrome c4 n=1 Tax=Marinobacter nanhaiticus D15-8W TaxID=626887 RepID=N6W628_9GAMM|nr:c-type cytochrome [Marinobacter nanhaiticus]ENO15659.1 cytochrome c4 [Marinobacter nanhaiticus D15-8W]BES73490.1 c-type cytochrome [Marinobacter nanhaiticus D15-8W]